MTSPLIQMADIVKVFPGGVVANDRVTLNVWGGTIHAVIGENGAGKTTLANILYGRHQPDQGRIRLRGVDVRIDSPARAIGLGLGMVTQHTTMIPALSVLDNILLGAEVRRFGVLSRRAARSRIEEIADRFGISLPWDAPAGSLSVAALQMAEIVKALFRRAEIIILDEPTATLGPREADSLFAMLHALAEGGGTLLLITHKLREVMAHASRVTVLRAGRSVAELATSDTYPDELLSLMMGGRRGAPPAASGIVLPMASMAAGEVGAPSASTSDTPTPPWERADAGAVGGGRTVAPPLPTLEVRGLTVLNDRGAEAVRDASLQALAGQIVGVAGVDGSGQRELAEAIVGLRPAQAGSVWLDGVDVTGWSAGRRLAHGVSTIAEDRQREGLILDFTLAENLLLGRQRQRRFGGGWFLDPATIEAHAEEVIRTYRMRAAGADVPVASLSGGNQQKVLVARALDGSPRLLVAMQPTRGLDVAATQFVYGAIRDACRKGMAALVFSLDLDEIFDLADVVLVMYNGAIVGALPRSAASMDLVGRMMVGTAAPVPQEGG